jgi:hypothetical protein
MAGEVSTSGFNVPGNFSQGVVSRYSLTGVLDTTFGANGYYITGLYGVLAAVTLAPDGSIIVTGAENFIPQGSTTYTTEMIVGHLSANGQADASFGSNGSGFAVIAAAGSGGFSAVWDNGNIVLGGAGAIVEVTGP